MRSNSRAIKRQSQLGKRGLLNDRRKVESRTCGGEPVMEVNFAVQDSISQKVVASLAVQMDEKRRRFEQRGTANTEAYQAYLRGRYF